MMTYIQTTTLIAAMDDLETYSRLAKGEVDKTMDDSDISAYKAYMGYIQKARGVIFNMVQEKSNENT